MCWNWILWFCCCYWHCQSTNLTGCVLEITWFTDPKMNVHSLIFLEILLWFYAWLEGYTFLCVFFSRFMSFLAFWRYLSLAKVSLERYLSGSIFFWWNTLHIDFLEEDFAYYYTTSMSLIESNVPWTITYHLSWEDSHFYYLIFCYQLHFIYLEDDVLLIYLCASFKL